MKWISVNDKLPPHCNDVLVAISGGVYAVAFFADRDRKWLSSYDVTENGGYGKRKLRGEVTAWAEIEPPEFDTCTIFGSEISFKLKVKEIELIDVAHDIWDHSSNYSNYKDNSESSYYKFTKYLWIRFPDGREVSLADFVKE